MPLSFRITPPHRRTRLAEPGARADVDAEMAADVAAAAEGPAGGGVLTGVGAGVVGLKAQQWCQRQLRRRCEWTHSAEPVWEAQLPCRWVRESQVLRQLQRGKQLL